MMTRVNPSTDDAMENLRDDSAVDLDNSPDSGRGIGDVSEAAARFIRTAFVPCDVPLASPAAAVAAQGVLPVYPPFRGTPILKPNLSALGGSGDAPNAGLATTTVVRSRVFPDTVAFVRFFSAAAAMDPAEVQRCGAAELLEASSGSSPSLPRLVCRHERLFRHPVSSACIAQAGLEVRVNNKKHKAPSSGSSSSSAVRWNLYFGARWRDEALFAAEMAAARAAGPPTVRVNHFPATHLITRKDNLAIQMQRMRLKFPADFDFTPPSFVLPRDGALFAAELARLREAAQPSQAVFIAKPPASSQGRGVFLFRTDGSAQLPPPVAAKMVGAAVAAPAVALSGAAASQKKKASAKAVTRRKSSSVNGTAAAAAASATVAVGDEDQEDDDDQEDAADENEDDAESEEQGDDVLLVQRYIERPLTIHGYKVDLRVYAAVTSFDPLKIFVFNDGLVRFATVPLQRGDDSDGKTAAAACAPLSELCAHLTNVSVNAKQQQQHQQTAGGGYRKTDSAEQDGTAEGSKWTLHALKRYVVSGAAEGEDGAAVWDRCWGGLCRAVTKAFICVQDEAASRVGTIVQSRNACFELFGFDVLLDAALKAHVLEVNYLPSLVCGSALDRHVKGHMMADLFSLAGVCAAPPAQPAAQAMVDGPILSAAAIRRRSPAVSDADFQQRLDGIIAKAAAAAAAGAGAPSAAAVATLRKRFFETVVDAADRGIVSYAEEELARRGGWERVFPTAASVAELRHLFGATPLRRGNRVLWAFEALKARGAFATPESVEELLLWMRAEQRMEEVAAPAPAAPAAVAAAAPPPPPTPTAKAKKVAAAPRVASVTRRKPVVALPRPAAAADTVAAPIACQVFSFQQIPPKRG